MALRPGYLQPETVSHNRWLISYTDIVTVLLILFVAVAAQGLRERPVPAAPVAAPLK
jgi:Membrane MotB of proton-channel complex MotA/MotB